MKVCDSKNPFLNEPPSVVLSTEAKSLYRRALRQGVLRPFAEQPSDAAPGQARRTAVDQLVRLGLLERNPAAEPGAGEEFLPIEPQIAEARIGVTWRAKALDLLSQAVDFSDQLAPFIEEHRKAPAPASASAALDRITGYQAINFQLDRALGECREELLTAQPGGGRPAELLKEAVERDRAVLQRGATMRTLYQHSAQFDVPTRQYVTEVTSIGAHVRTLDEFFKRLIVVDRRVAFIPAADDDSAVVIHDEAVVHYLADVFDRNWQRATAFPVGQSPAVTRRIANEVRQSIIRLLVEGESEAVIAKRIGLSKRSCAAHIAKIKQQLGAETLFQLGYRVATAEPALTTTRAAAPHTVPPAVPENPPSRSHGDDRAVSRAVHDVI
ncbi:LuxR family transcriptional regulator [Streptomyces sp. Ru73]|uniref:LuxR family transcriptional regulator n=1 Tax=Streptomyces sp. Ru73 TaxID=2080748 RepID=UPI000CDCF09E|nr:LuxR family transcriptional regulator [Streptomyces sp. Ru73]POX41456.1 LuxR family transcriptional regulator [Streptomyces sp. Ru73]